MKYQWNLFHKNLSIIDMASRLMSHLLKQPSRLKPRLYDKSGSHQSLTQRPNHYKYIGGQSIFNGVNLPIGPSAGTINYGLFVGSGGSVLLEEGH